MATNNEERPPSSGNMVPIVRRRMVFSTTQRVFLWASAISMAVLSALTLPQLIRTKLEIENWIPEPKSGMDVSSFDARHVLLASADPRENVVWHGTSYTLAEHCGDGREDTPERYAIIAGKFRRHEQVKITIEDKYAHVEISEHYQWRLHDRGVQMPHHGSRKPMYYREYNPPSLIVKGKVPIEMLEGIRVTWLNAELWDAPQKDSECWRADGTALLLESCTHGRYFVRYRYCAPEEHEPANRMREEIKELSETMLKYQ